MMKVSGRIVQSMVSAKSAERISVGVIVDHRHQEDIIKRHRKKIFAEIYCIILYRLFATFDYVMW